MLQNKTEIGRSLTEMLATLAIMAVLSIGSIAGFNYAMNKHRANELLDEARKRAYTVMTQIQLGLTQSLGEYSRYNTFAGGTFGSEIVTEGLSDRFGLKVTGVKKAVCQNLVDSIGISTPLRWVATGSKPSVEIESCADEGDYILVYNNSLTAENAKPCKTDSDCGECGTCNSQGGICHYPERDTKRCPTASPYCNAGSCQSCEIGKWENPGHGCRTCVSAYHIMFNLPRSECMACPQFYIPYHQTEETVTCLKCPGVVSADRKTCDFQCPAGQYGHIGKLSCVDCTSTASEDITNATHNNECRKCAGIRFWVQEWSQCFPCTSAANQYGTNRADCLGCPQRYMPGTAETGVACYLCSGFVNDNGTTCYACDKSESVATTKARCQQCRGTRYYDSGYCLLCPAQNTAAWHELSLEQKDWCTVE